ncbi:MAG: RluA family pseudouridine synthase [Syntrophobacteraceae bacterium]
MERFRARPRHERKGPALNNGFEYREQIGGQGSGLSVIAYLTRTYRHSSEAQWRDRVERGEVYLDGLEARSDAVLKPGHLLFWKRPPWEEPDAPLAHSVLHEDEDLLAVAKPCGLPTLPGAGFLEHTLLFLVRKGHPEAAPVHRLGRGTSGVVLFARTARARSALCAAWRQNEVIKIYRALASGTPATENFSIEARIGPVPHPKLGSVHAARADGKYALSRVTVLERRMDASLLEVIIETGRPHQIRIHLAAAGHPLIGDPLYGAGGGLVDAGALPGDCGYLLHAERVRLRHPATGKHLEIVCSPPPELRLGSEAG